jgi:hypothetical protein
VLKLSAGRQDLLRHKSTSKHQANIKLIGIDIIRQLTENPVQKAKDLKMAAEIEWVMMGIKYNLSFEQMANISQDLTKTNNKFIKIESCEMSPTKARCISTNVIQPIEQKYILHLMRTQKWSLLVDESTDKGKVKQLAIVIRTFDMENVHDYFYDILPVNDGSVVGLYKLLTDKFNSDNVPYRTNMIGYASDGASVVSGCKDSLVTKLKADIPTLFTMKCVCHSFALCASHACSKLSSSSETLLKSVYNYIRNNYKHRHEFEKLMLIHDMEPLQLLYPSQTRWLSLEAVVNRVLTLWNVLLDFFRTESKNGTVDHSFQK